MKNLKSKIERGENITLLLTRSACGVRVHITPLRLVHHSTSRTSQDSITLYYRISIYLLSVFIIIFYPKQTKSAQQKTIQIYIYILIYLNSLISTIGKDIDTSVQIDTKK